MRGWWAGTVVGGRLGLRWVRVQGAAIWRISCCGVGNGGVLVALESMIRGVGSGSGDHRAMGGLLVLGLLEIGVAC